MNLENIEYITVCLHLHKPPKQIKLINAVTYQNNGWLIGSEQKGVVTVTILLQVAVIQICVLCENSFSYTLETRALLFMHVLLQPKVYLRNTSTVVFRNDRLLTSEFYK